MANEESRSSVKGACSYGARSKTVQIGAGRILSSTEGTGPDGPYLLQSTLLTYTWCVVSVDRANQTSDQGVGDYAIHDRQHQR